MILILVIEVYSTLPNPNFLEINSYKTKNFVKM